MSTAVVPHPKEGDLRIFIAVKNHRPQSGLNPRALGPVVNAITTRPRKST
jgi:hypothetical protein